MEAYIKYKRISQKFNADELQNQFDELISGGWEILYYNESPAVSVDSALWVIMIVGKKQSKML